MIDAAAVRNELTAAWSGELAGHVAELVGVPSVSPSFDPQWSEHGHLAAAVGLVARHMQDLLPAGTSVRELTLAGRSPVLLCDVPATAPGPTVLCYGHLDVQPPGHGWTVTTAFEPVVTGSRLVGRGAGDDGYAPYLVAGVLARLAHHPRTVILLETSEESSSVDLPAYLDAFADDLGDPEVVLCLDAFVPDNERLWVTSSMRGIIVADLAVSMYEHDVHSGMAGGVTASTFRVLRHLLDRIEDSDTGDVLLEELDAPIPPGHLELLQQYCAILGSPPSADVAVLPGVRPVHDDPLEQLTAQCWKPSIAYTGIDGAPATTAAGSVLRAGTTVRLSVRVPPTVDPQVAAAALGRALTADAPYGARVDFDIVAAESGWVGHLPPAVEEALAAAGRAGYDAETAQCAGGATIPFLGMFSRRYPDAVILPVGLLAPDCNAHGPDEYLDLAAAGRLSTAVAVLLDSLVTKGNVAP